MGKVLMGKAMPEHSRVTSIGEPESWREAAACLTAGDEISFFPTPEDAQMATAAKAVCATCPVVDSCLSYAIETNQTEGVWGGTTSAERTKLRRRWLRELRQAS
jgi:WhiB family redox-sensing transcriptional regulator